MRPELNIKKKVQALERRRSQFDALVEFIKTHPKTACECTLLPLAHRTGLLFDGYAIIRPMWKGNKPTLRLEKYLENWYELHPDDFDPFDFRARTVFEDVSKMSDKKVLDVLDKVHRELLPEDFEDEEENIPDD
jgi:hypothetical protein